MITMTMTGARVAGYRALTSSYQLPEEEALLKNVLADMRRGNISHVLVKEGGGVAVWRGGVGGTRTVPVGAGAGRERDRRGLPYRRVELCLSKRSNLQVNNRGRANAPRRRSR